MGEINEIKFNSNHRTKKMDYMVCEMKKKKNRKTILGIFNLNSQWKMRERMHPQQLQRSKHKNKLGLLPKRNNLF